MPHSSQLVSTNRHYSHLQPSSHGFALKSYTGQPQSLPNILPPTPPNHIQTWLARKPDRPIPQFEVHTLDDNCRKNFIPTNRDMHLDRPRLQRYKLHRQKSHGQNQRAAVAENCPLPLFHEDYGPEPPSMLSNFRFNIFTRFYDDFMYIELVPRSSKGIPLEYIKEASFMFGLVKPFNWTEEHACYLGISLSFVS
ncbi:hypothetical protein TWF970_011314 [Orbilia oligospora]|uniref:Uncharacterized protein n=1 Tax=Orbilia oligospora TaxID=2813651 RepID=A0A7C8RC70_ORBOL|nr:hypothetical protein TWF970_011314 [Orbilia oligospora]